MLLNCKLSDSFHPIKKQNQIKPQTTLSVARKAIWNTVHSDTIPVKLVITELIQKNRHHKIKNILIKLDICKLIYVLGLGGLGMK